MAYLLNQPYNPQTNADAPIPPEMLARQRQFGEGELQAGMDTSPIRSPWQGAARLAQAIMGGLAVRSANTKELGYRSQAMQGLIDAMNGKSGAPSGIDAGGHEVGPESVGSSTPGMAAVSQASGPDTGKLFSAATNPYLNPAASGVASALLSAQLMPHPKSITYNPITGAAGTFEPFSGAYAPLADASAATSGNGVYPPGFVFGGAKPFTDASTGESGLIDVNGVKAIIGKANPSTDQAAASAAAALAHKANDLLNGVEGTQTGGGSAIERQAMNLPIVGPLFSGPKARDFETGKAQFQSAVRALAIAKGINPEQLDFNEKALFAQQGDGPEEVAQKQAYRDQIITNLEKRAGSFVQDVGGAKPAPEAPAASATKPTVKSDADYNALPSGTHFIDPEGKERVKP